MVPGFRKELSDLRQREIRSSARLARAGGIQRERLAIRVLDAAARGLRRVAGRLDQAALLSRERDRAFIRRP